MQNRTCGGECPACSAAGAMLQQPPVNHHAEGKKTTAPLTRFTVPAGKVALIGAAALFFFLGLGFRGWLQHFSSPWPGHALFLLAYLLAGGRVIRQALDHLFRGRLMDEYFLMAAASAGAIAIGELPEAAAVMLFFSVGELLEESAVNRSRRSIAALMEIRPDYANLISADKGIIRVRPEAVRPGQTILVRPGEKIPLDGTVEQGKSYVDHAALTGESLPQRVEEGDTVMAGAVNSTGLLQIRVEREYGESSLAKIFRLTEQAAARKAKTEQFITRFARYYTPAVVLSALAVAVLPPLLAGVDFHSWLYRALVLLVISCPCALVISVPLSYFSGIGSASRHGILVKGGNFLEALHQVQTVVFDKTGTLTRGTFEVEEVLTQPGWTEDQLLFYAAHAEYYSQHPLARAVVKAYSGQLFPSAIRAYTEKRGLGVKATVQNYTVLAGSLLFLRQQGVETFPCSSAGSAVYVAVEGRYAGCLVVRDQLKEDASLAMRRLRDLGLATVMLTGDREEAAADIAGRIGVDRYWAGLLPEDKVAKIEDLQAAGGKLAFVGDGINDAPALTRAEVGIAMGGLGTDAAIEAADVVIMDDKPSRVARAIEIAAFTRKIVIQNIVLALGVKGLFAAMGVLGAASIWEAVFADVGVALIAIINATRLLRVNFRHN